MEVGRETQIGANLKEEEHLEDQSVDERIISKWILKK
jgi:hypothetical protein